MGSCVTKLPHSCGTRKGLQVFENEGGVLSGYCYSCNTYVKDPLGVGKTVDDIPKAKLIPRKTKEEIEEEVGEIHNLSACNLLSRKIGKGSLDKFGIKVGFDEEDGETPRFVFFPYKKNGVFKAYKVRLLEPKRMWSLGDQSDVDLFGWDEAVKSGAKRLIITEGEFDAVALTGIIEKHTTEKFADFKPAVVSLPHGAASAYNDLSRLASKINKSFKDVSFCFDSDKAGLAALDDSMKVIPHATSISLPEKDANECVIKGCTKAAFKALTFNADKPKNTRLVWGNEVHEAAKEQAAWGLATPFGDLTEYTRGWRFGETIYIGAGEKMGKSELVNTLAADLIATHNLKVMLAKPEEANNKSYKLLCGKVAGKIFHDPKIEFDEAAYEKAGALIKENVCMLNLYQKLDWDVLQADIRYAVGEGVKAVFIDPITNLTNGMSSSEVDSHLRGVAQDLAALAKDLDIIIFIFCHLNKPAKGSKPWDRGGKITTDYFAGSSAMARSCNYAIGMEGDKDPDLSMEERNMRTLVLLADREYGESGSVRLYWDYKTGLFNEVE